MGISWVYLLTIINPIINPGWWYYTYPSGKSMSESQLGCWDDKIPNML